MLPVERFIGWRGRGIMEQGASQYESVECRVRVWGGEGGDWKIVGSDRVLPLLNTVSGSSLGRAGRHRDSLPFVI